MDIMELGAIGELVGGSAVLATLAYLALQVRQSNRHAQASTETAWIEGWNRVLGDWVESKASIHAIREGFGNFDELPKDEQAVFHMKIAPMVNQWFLARQLQAKGLLSSELFHECTKVVGSTLATPGGRLFWARDAGNNPAGKELSQLLTRENQSDLAETHPWWAPDTARAEGA